MVKKGLSSNKYIQEFLDVLISESEADYILLADSKLSQAYASSNIDLAKVGDDELEEILGQSDLGDNAQKDGFLIKDLEGWGKIAFKNPKNLDDEGFWDYANPLLTHLLTSEDVSKRTKLVVSLTSEIRKTFKPELALEKIYKEFNDFFGAEEMFFFKKSLEEDKYEVFFQENVGDKVLGKKYLGLDEINDYEYLSSGLEKVSLECKVRNRQWGFLVLARKEKWDEDDTDIINPFTEQIASVFNQHELHLESLTMAQREFLLNQITTTIREHLEVDKIIEIAAQEIAQVMGVEACGITILDRTMRTTRNHSVWATEEELSKKMTALMKRSVNSEYCPNPENPMVSISRFSDKKDSLANFFSDLLGAKSYLSCTLSSHDNNEMLGVLSVAFFNQDRTWTDNEEQLLESISLQLEMALMQAAIYQESQQTKMQMALLHNLSNDIRGSLEISKVLERIAKGLGEILGLSRCFVRRFTDNARILKTEKEYHAEGFFPSADIIFDFEEKWIQELEKQDLTNIEKEGFKFLSIPYVKAKMMSEDSPLLSIAEAIDLKSYLCVPLIARGKVLGTINVHQCDRERNFLPEEIEFVCRAASEAAVAIAHAELFETIDIMSRTDPDTGLFNKSFFKEIAEEEIEIAKKEKKPICYIMLDLDHLKAINDTPDIGGHEAGDEAIKIAAAVMENTVRQTPIDEVRSRRADVVARFGGDEFMILLPDTKLEDGVTVANRILSNLQKSKHSTWNKPLTLSVGVAGAPEDGYDYESLKLQADKALYLSKEKGRATVSSTLELKS